MDYINKSKKFLLRPYKKSDLKNMVKNINHKYIYKNTLQIPYPYKIKDGKKWINHCLCIGKKRNPKEIHFAIDRHGEVIGCVGFLNIEKHKAELGYWLAKRYWNQGIISEAIKLLLKYGFDKLKLRRIYANVFLRNKASAKVLEKNFFKREALMKKYYFKDGKILDALLYARIK